MNKHSKNKRSTHIGALGKHPPASAARSTFFDPDNYTSRLPAEDECWGCQKPWKEYRATEAERQRLLAMTGCPERFDIVLLPLRKDLRSLGMDASCAPERLALCIRCSVRYMEEFTRRLAEQNQGSHR